MSTRQLRRRAGFTLIEMAFVAVFVSIFALFLMQTVITSTHSNQETWAEGEVVEFVGRTVDAISAELATGNNFVGIDTQPTWGTTATGDNLVFQQTFDANNDGVREVGANNTAGLAIRIRLVTDLNLNEVRANYDYNGDGDRADTAVPAGHLQVQLLNGATVQRTTDIGSPAQRTHIIASAWETNAPAGFRRIFSEAPAVGTVPPFSDQPTLRLGGATGASIGTTRSVQVNLTFAREPYPDRVGQPVVNAIRNIRRIYVLP